MKILILLRYRLLLRIYRTDYPLHLNWMLVAVMDPQALWTNIFDTFQGETNLEHIFK